MVDAIAGSNNSSLTSTGALGKLGEDFDDFITIMIAQLENQDPTEPLDANEFTNQIVSFSEVEASINTNNKLDQLITLTQNTQVSNIVSFAGKTVEVEGHSVELNEEGSVSFSYELPEDVVKSFITIRDELGDVVFTADGAKGFGRHNFEWNGNDLDEERLNAGNYDVFVSHENINGIVDTVPTFVKGTVTGIDLSKDELTLFVNGEEILLDDVEFIGEEI